MSTTQKFAFETTREIDLEHPSQTRKAGASSILPGAFGRRQLLGGAGALAVGAAAAALFEVPAAEAAGLTDYFSVLATGEALFVTFYENAVKHAEELRLYGDALVAIQAILAEEQLHYNFAVNNGGTPATTHFSFPYGADTFKHRRLFLKTQQLGEELTNGALLAWIFDMASMGNTRLAQIGGQLQQVEGGHRVIGRVIGDEDPWGDWGFGPVAAALNNNFLNVPTVVAAAGFLSPVPGNDFTFQPVNPSFPGLINTSP
ncbi:MAG TPA: hypothetical protein VEK34_09180 [Methylocella sp.]|nr:hypothetical protein [Methylocella sp.]